MRLSLPGSPHLTYCTNIHRGESWAEIRAGIDEHLPPIKQALSPDAPMAVGLRLSGIAADALADHLAMADFRAFLAAHDLYVLTLNAFPYGPFHGTRVKEEVYQPDWSMPERLRFTDIAADIIARLLPDGLEGSVSTCPGTFRPLAAEPARVRLIVDHLVRHVARLVQIERTTGKRVALAIEPEPCCMLETIAETIEFFVERLFDRQARARLGALTDLDDGAAERALRQHLGICYDVCHAAVEFEDPKLSLQAIDAAGIRITKLQLSSALEVPQVNAETEALLRTFDDGVYLHQTIEQRGNSLTRHVDLAQAFAALRAGQAGGKWRVHCHVPVFAASYGALSSTQDFLETILQECRERQVSAHLEVETYTWDVLPPELRGVTKTDAIIRELAWVRERLMA